MNAEEVARFLGCSSKTVRRHLEKGTITASRKASGELKISDDQVEKLRRVLELEDTSRHVQQKPPMGRPEQTDMSRQVETDIDMERRLASMAQSIANLNATVANQTRRIGELAARVAQLEGQASLDRPRQPVPPSATPDIPPKSQAPIRNVALPDGCVLASEFAKLHGMPPTTFKHHIEHGVAGEKVEVERRPKHGRPKDTERYLTPNQQEKALEFWKRHNVKFTQH